MASIDFVLDSFDLSLNMTTKALLTTGQAPGTITSDAIASYEISLAAAKSAFYFETDSTDMLDASASDIHYYVNWPAAYVLNPAHAYVYDSPIAITGPDGALANNRLLVKHDFVRHIAKELFNTHLAVDLFSNEEATVEDIASKGHTAWTNNIKSKIDAVSAGGALVDPSGGYTTNALDTSANLCRVLFQQMMYSDSSRFTNLNTLASTDVSYVYYLPFKANDSISFKVVLYPEATQNDIVNSNTPVPSRSYRIKIKIVSTTPSNVAVNDGSFTTSRVVT